MVDILYPVFALVLLTFLFVVWMARERMGALKRGEIARPDPGIRPDWPGRAGKVSNAYLNLVELPVLFYAVVAFAMIAKGDDTMMVLLAWLFVAFRYAQAFIHATYNKILHRFLAFLGGILVLAAMWIKLFMHVVTASV